MLSARHCRLAVVLMLLGAASAGCGPRPAPAGPAGAPEIDVAGAPAPARLALLACTFGGPRRLGRVDVAKVPARVVAVVEVEAKVPLAGVSVASLEVFDASGTRLGYGLTPTTLRRASGYRPPAEPLDAETADFDGTLAPGTPVRLWIDATLDVPLKQLLDVSPARVDATLDLGGGRQVQVTGRVGGLWTG
jgi:hypothetical protein